MIEKEMLAKRAKEAVGRMFGQKTYDEKKMERLERENVELRKRLAICELQLFNTTVIMQDIVEQKDAEIAKLYAEAVQARDLSPFQYGTQMPWSKS